jgi:MFS family permease
MKTSGQPTPENPETSTTRLLPFFAMAPFYGWWVLLSLASLRVIASGVGNNVRSLLVLPMERDFGATRAEISLMATMGSIAIVVTGPLGGWLMDRYGTRRVMFVCLLITTAGYLLLSQTVALWQVILIFTIPLGVAYNWAVLNSGAPILNNWFDRQKARSLSLLNVGHGAGALLLPLMALLITGVGWRPAMVVAGLVLLAAGMVVVLVARDTPEEMGLTPDGDPPKEEVAGVPRPAMGGADLKQAMRTPYFWALGIGSACMLIINVSIVFHMVPLVESRGQSEEMGATLLSLQLFLTVPIVLVTAWGADRLDGTKVLVVMMAFTFAGVGVLMAANHAAVYVLAMACLAFGGSHWAILWAVLGHKYGRRHYNAIRMSIYSILTAGIAAGPLLAGISYDATQSYDQWLQILLVIGAVGVATFLYALKAAKLPMPGMTPRTVS